MSKAVADSDRIHQAEESQLCWGSESVLRTLTESQQWRPVRQSIQQPAPWHHRRLKGKSVAVATIDSFSLSFFYILPLRRPPSPLSLFNSSEFFPLPRLLDFYFNNSLQKCRSSFLLVSQSEATAYNPNVTWSVVHRAGYTDCLHKARALLLVGKCTPR